MVRPVERAPVCGCGLNGLEGGVLLAVVARPVAVVGVEEDDLLGVDLGLGAALAVLRLPRVLDEASGDVDPLALADVLVQ